MEGPKRTLEFLKHQVDTVKFIAASHRDQHGLLLYQKLGSGKTYTALYAAKNYPNNKTILMVPNTVSNLWKRVAKEIGVPLFDIYHLDQLTPTFFDLHKKDIEDSFLIIDEAHNFVEFLELISEGQTSLPVDSDDEVTDGKKSKKSSSSKKKSSSKTMSKKKKPTKETKNALVNILEILNNSKKLLLLTGTPIRNYITDLRWYINLASGKKTVPYNNDEFIRDYTKESETSIFINGWLNKVLNYRNPVKGYLNFSTENEDLRISYDNIDNLQGYISAVVFGMLPIFEKISKKRGIDINNISKLNAPKITEYIKKKGIVDYMIKVTDNLKKTEETKDNFFTISNSVGEDLRKISTNIDAGKIDLTLVSQLLATMIVTKGVIVLAKHLLESINEGARLDENKLRDIGPFISYYKQDNSVEYYPIVQVKNRKVPYTDYQLGLWIRVIYRSGVTDQESVYLGFNKNIKEAELFKPNYIGESTYLNKCAVIGNLIQTGSNIEVPIKFKKIAEMYKLNEVCTLVYSSFNISLLILQRYLISHGIYCVYYTPDLSDAEKDKIIDDFEKQKIKMLLLHPDFFEGFSVRGTRVFHVLEPINSYYKKEQLYARVSRYKSHIHLPKLKRHVSIYQWRCSISDTVEKLKTQKGIFTNWLANSTSKIYFSYFAEFSDKFTPDDQIFFGNEKIKKILDDCDKKIQVITIDKYKQPVKCNIENDPSPIRKLPKCKNLK